MAQSTAQNMAETKYEPSGSHVSKAESDVAQTISLAGSIITLVREPVALVYKNVARGQKLKRSLGAWQPEAMDEAGRCRIPMLRGEEYERHLVATDGVVPAGQRDATPVTSPTRWSLGFLFGNQKQGPAPPPPFPSSGTACWGYLLHALGVHPGGNVVDWRPSADGLVSTQNGGIEMEMEGSALCHIINIYSLTPDMYSCSHGREYRLDRQADKKSRFTFGELAWDAVGDQLHAHFTPGPEKELVSAKRPFGLDESDTDPGTIMASYLTALLHGTSDPDLRLASPRAPLRKRITRLMSCIHKIMDPPKPPSFMSLKTPQKGPILISLDWLEEASRVKRRVLAQGGGDRSLFDDMVENINSRPSLDPDWVEWLRALVRDMFLFDSERFTVLHEYVGDETSLPRCAIRPSDVCKDTLLGYADHPPGSWRRDLFDMKDAVLDVLSIPRDLYSCGRKLQYIEFTRTCDMWHKTVLLGAPDIA